MRTLVPSVKKKTQFEKVTILLPCVARPERLQDLQQVCGVVLLVNEN